MSSQKHIIRKLVVEIEAATREEAMEVQNRFHNEYKRLVLGILEELFAGLIGEDEVIRIEKLEIDLGEISKERISYEIPEKVRKETEDALVKIVHELRESSGKTSIRTTNSSGDTITVEASRQPVSLTAFENLLYLLDYGVLPWSGDKQEKKSFRELMAIAMEKHPERLRNELVKRKDKAYLFRRLALQLPEDQLQYLAAITGSRFSSRLILLHRELYAWFGQLRTRIAVRERKTLPSFESEFFKSLNWAETLRYFAQQDQATAFDANDEKTLIEFLLETILAKENFWENVSAVLVGRNKALPAVEAAFVSLAEKKAGNGFLVKALPAFVPGAAGSTKAKTKTKAKAKAKTPASRAGEAEKKASLPKAQENATAVAKKNAPEEQLPEAPETDEGIYIGNAGLVIIAPYLSRFFENCGFVRERKFTSEEAKWQAVHLLQYLADGDDTQDQEQHEHNLVLNKILCGLEIAEPVPAVLELSAEQKENAVALLKAVIANWPIIKNISVQTLRTTFLQKEGRLERHGSDWMLKINRDSVVETLIDRLPWGISIVRMPWMKETVYTEW